MKRSTIIFGSNSEIRAYTAIDKHLPEGWRLFSNTPLSNIVKIQKNELSEKKWEFYLKASVDFVLTNPTHEPILAIEFDGLGGGYSAGKKYILKRSTEQDPYRELKMSFKLDTCYAVGLPLIVLSFEEIESLSGGDVLSMVNSMVGQHIVSLEYRDAITQWDREGRGAGKTFEQMLWEDSQLRTQLSFKYDPVLSELEENWKDFEKLGANWSMSSVSRPDSMTALREKRAFDSVGSRYVVKGGELATPVMVTVWVRNFAGEEMGSSLISEFFPSSGINPLKVAENVAMYLGQKRAVELARE